MLGQLAKGLYKLGRWDEALAAASQVTESDLGVGGGTIDALEAREWIGTARSLPGQAPEMPAIVAEFKDRTDVQDRSVYLEMRSESLHAQGQIAEALATCEEAIASMSVLGIRSESLRRAYTLACQCACELGDQDKLLELLTALKRYPPGHVTRSLKAQMARVQARLAAMTGADGAANQFRGAEAGFRELGDAYALAQTLREHASWLVTQDKGAEAGPLLAEAEEIYARLGIGGRQSSSEVSSATTSEAGLTSVTAATDRPA